MNKAKKYKKKISVFLIIIIVLQLVSINMHSSVSASNGITWALDDYYNNPYLEVVSINQEDGKIVLRGTHNKKTNDNYYKTDGFVMTLEPYNISGEFPSSARDNRIYYKSKPEKDNGTTVTYLYTLKFEDIVSMASELNISGEDIGNGTVPIYLHTVYDIYKGENRVVNDVIGVQEMLNAPVKHRLGYTAWNPATQEKIPSYYNMRFDLSISSTYHIEVVAVDTEGNPLAGAKNNNGDTLPEKLLKKQVIYNENFNYNLKEDDKSVTFNGCNFTFSNWYYGYTNRSPKKDMKTSPVNTDWVKFNAPDALPGSVLTVYMVYDKEDSPPYYVDIIAETEDGKKLTTFVKDDEVQPMVTYKYELSENQKVLQDKYYYSNKWFLTYTDNKTDELITMETRHREDILLVMPDAKAGSTATFHMIYGLEPGETPTPTPDPEPDPDPGWEIPTIVPPLPDHKSMPFTKVTATGCIRADD
ncbi:MAG: hypothetical protein GX963_11160, partial [Bacteroidales bacterium]|nr:hypothetical protein [Bacteroidales bacterium]